MGVRRVTLLAELNDMELWSTDIGNAYLESYTKEKVLFVAGPEFGELQGHLLVIVKALYGLRSSGAMIYALLALEQACLFPSKQCQLKNNFFIFFLEENM